MTDTQDLKNQVLHSLKWVALGKVATQVVRWAMTFWVIRMLVPEDYGVVAMADIVFGFLPLLIGPLFTPALIQAKNLSEKALKQTFGMIIILYSAIFFLQIGFADAIGAFYQSENVASILKVNAWAYLVIALKVIPSALLARSMDFKRISIISAIANITAALTTLALAYLGYGFWALIIGEMTSLILRTILILVIKPITFLPEFKISEVTPHMRFGGILTLHSIIFYVFLHMDIAIAGQFMSAAEVGLYAIGLQFALMPQKKMLPLLKEVAFPAFSKIQDQPKRINAYIVKSQKLSLLVTIPIFWGLGVTVDQIIPIVIGEKWSGAIIPTMIILFVMPLRFSEELFNPALKSLRKVKHLLVNVLIMMVIILICLLYFMDMGATGLALAWGVGFPLSYLIIATRNCRSFKIPVTDILKSFRSPFIAGILMVVSVYLSKEWLSAVVIPNLLGQIAIGAVTFAASIWLLDKKSLVEMSAMLRNKRT
jgi:O-antigen/teichoic acid export membrane protein